MQALAERLDALLAGAPFAGASALQFSAAKTVEPPVESFVDRSLSQVSRRGKYLVFDFGGPRILVHLSQGGRVDLEDPPKTTRGKGGVVRFRFRDKPSVLFKEYGTQRKAGWWTVAEGDEGPLTRLGPEPYSRDFEELVLGGSDTRRIHTLLRDQRTVAGIGRGYADDILHAAHLSPYVSLAKLNEKERRRLIDTVHTVLRQALDRERQRVGGLPAKLDNRFTVHGRLGESCPRCGDALRRVSYESYEVTYCAACQTGGQALADRRLSRLIR